MNEHYNEESFEKFLGNGVALFSGMLFSVGIITSGMIDPSKVQSFLDILGNWQPHLIFVMMGAVTVNLISFHHILKASRPPLASRFYLPTKTQLDPSLIIGSWIFGVGWGISGICPGPALAALPLLSAKMWGFFAAMLGGMVIYHYFPNPIELLTRGKSRGRKEPVAL